MFGIGKKEDEVSAETPAEIPAPTDESAPDSAPNTETGNPQETPLLDSQSQPESAPDSAPDSAPEVPPAEASVDAKEALSSDDFHDFIATNVLTFLNIMDIENNGSRRDALVALKLKEEGIRLRMNLASAYLKLLFDYALIRDLPALVTESEMYLGKLAAMKQWLTM